MKTVSVKLKLYQINLIDHRIGKEIKCKFSANRNSTPTERLYCSHFLSSGLLLSLLSLDSVLKEKLAMFLTPANFFLYVFLLL